MRQRQREDLWIWSSRESQDCTPHLLTLRRDGETCFWPLPENADCQRREETVTITLGTQTLTLSPGRNQQRTAVPGSHSAGLHPMHVPSDSFLSQCLCRGASTDLLFPWSAPALRRTARSPSAALFPAARPSQNHSYHVGMNNPLK